MSEPNGRAIIENGARASVLLPLVFNDAFDYRVPPGVTLGAGDFVRVPFGPRSVWGVVWGEGAGACEEKKLKSIEALAAHVPPMQAAMRAFIDWVAWYTLSPRGQVLKMALAVPDALEPPKEEMRYRVKNGEEGDKGGGGKNGRLTPARLRILSYLSDGGARSVKDITLHAKVSPAVLREFIKAGGLSEAPATSTPHSLNSPPPSAASPALSPDQSAAAASLRDKCGAGFSVTLLDGVTGSGKTEVYFDTIARVLERGEQALVLLPEIALSVQFLARFTAHFGFAPECWHSGLTPAARRESWRRIALGQARVVAGARSALFLPYRTLGVIIVDEEHDASYKQEEGVIYQARDMAVARARQEQIPAVLVSATPSLETEFNLQAKRYGRVHLAQRHAEAALPDIKLIDMRRQKLSQGQWISPPLKAALLEALERGGQAMLFMNRRGYAPLMLCRACGHRFHCAQCTAFLVYHRKRGRLVCHHCAHEAPVPAACPECGAADTLIPYGPGVERIAEEAQALLPQARIKVMTSDVSDTPARAAALVDAMTDGSIDILVGTQMIAKGHHFARLALVGVMDADMGLAGGDLRAGERTYQLLHQVAGRAGREKIKGEAWLQTYMPDHPVMQALAQGDRDRFMRLEAAMREDAEMPPYGRLAAFIIEGVGEREVADHARLIVARAQEIPAPDAGAILPLILGPAPAPLALLRGKFRYRVLIKAARSFPLQEWLAVLLANAPAPRGVKVKTDVEPYSFL